MQSLRSTSVRQLCRSATASITRLPRNPLLPALFCRTQPFTSSPTRWYSSTSQFHHQDIKEIEEEKLTKAEPELELGLELKLEETKKFVTLHVPATVHRLMLLD